MKMLKALMIFCFFAITATKIEASDDDRKPFKIARIMTSPTGPVTLLAILSPQARILEPQLSKLDVWKKKMSHISLRLNGENLVSCIQKIDMTSLGIVNQQVFKIVEGLHDFRIDATCLSHSEFSRVNPWNISKILHEFSSMSGDLAIKIKQEPYENNILLMMRRDYAAIRYELTIRGLYRDKNLLNEPLSCEVMAFYDRACKFRADLFEGEKSKILLEDELHDLDDHQPVCTNLQQDMKNKIGRLIKTLSIYKQNEQIIYRTPNNQIAVRKMLSESENLAQEIFLSQDQSQHAQYAAQYQQLFEDYVTTDFGVHEKEAIASLLLIQNLIANKADDNV